MIEMLNNLETYLTLKKFLTIALIDDGKFVEIVIKTIFKRLVQLDYTLKLLNIFTEKKKKKSVLYLLVL